MISVCVRDKRSSNVLVGERETKPDNKTPPTAQTIHLRTEEICLRL